MIRVWATHLAPMMSIPRESGDDPKFFVCGDVLYEYSPRERG